MLPLAVSERSEIVSCVPDWPPNQDGAGNDFELLILLILPHKCWNYSRKEPACPVYGVLSIKPRVSCMLSTCCTIEALLSSCLHFILPLSFHSHAVPLEEICDCLLFHRMWFQFPEPTWQLITACNSRFRGPLTFIQTYI